MKIEKLSKGNSKIFLAGVVITLVLVVVINLFLSYSKYKLESSVDLAEGTVNYTIPDLKLMAIYIKDDNGTFKEGTIQSNTTYQVVKDNTNNSSYCIDQTTGKKIDDVYMKFEDGKIDIKVDKKGTKCWVYLEKAKYLNEDILAKNPPKESTYNTTYKNIAEFTKIATDDEGVFKMADYDEDPTYYFRGAVTDNYVKFAKNKEGQDLYWRIIRINSDGSIRMIYDGTSAHANGEASEDRAVGSSVLNENYHDAKFGGFMYGGAKDKTSESYAEATRNETNSDILNFLEDWYANNLQKYGSYLEKNAIFCNDRRSSSDLNLKWDKWLETRKNTNGYGAGSDYPTLYGGSMRIISKSLMYADLSCQPNDRFTPKGAIKGNKAMKYPIGLITSDEIVMAGALSDASNSEIYLYTGHAFWTMSPSILIEAEGGIMHASHAGSGQSLGGGWVNGIAGVKPVINLKANTTFSKGNGTINFPYEIV